MVQKLKLWLQVLYLCLATTLSVTTAKTRSVDKCALLALRNLISSDQDLLANWVATSDPCSDSWSGVSCTCSDLQAPLSAAACSAATAGRNDTVKQLDFGAFSRQMTGVLAPELGNLTYLQSLQLGGQTFQVKLACNCCYVNVRLCLDEACMHLISLKTILLCTVLHMPTESSLHTQLLTANTLLVLQIMHAVATWLFSQHICWLSRAPPPSPLHPHSHPLPC